jgi:hypothetical protein
VDIPCYTSGERLSGLTAWLKPGACVVIQGELTPRPGAGGLEVYARRVERMTAA